MSKSNYDGSIKEKIAKKCDVGRMLGVFIGSNSSFVKSEGAPQTRNWGTYFKERRIK